MQKAYSSLHASRALLFLCIGIIAGVAVATQFTYFLQLDGILLTGCFLVILYMLVRSARVRLFAIVLLAVCIACWRVSGLPDYSNNPYDQMLTFQGTVEREPEILVDSQRLIVNTLAFEGLVQIKRPLQPRYEVGERLEVYCFLRQPEPFDGFAYDKYLQRYGISGVCHYPGITALGIEDGFHRRLFMLKGWMESRIEQALAPPESTIILGALFGNKRAIPPQIMDAFRATGTSHVLVISGMHVALLTSLFTRLLKRIGLSRRNVVLAVICTLGLYVLFTGLQSSAIRAAIFGSSALIAELLGRSRQSLRLLVIAAAGMLLWNPMLLWYDAGFQLSFAATAGIIVFNPFFEKKLQYMPTVFGLRSTAATSVSAIVATTPITIFSFHTFSPIALFANLVVVPLMPIIMTYSICLTALSALSTQIAMWAGLPLYYLLHIRHDCSCLL